MEIAKLKAWVASLELLVDKLVNPPPAVPQEVTFRVPSPLPDIGSQMRFLG